MFIGRCIGPGDPTGPINARSNKGMPINFLLNPYSDLVLSELVNPVLFDALPQKHQVKWRKNTK